MTDLKLVPAPQSSDDAPRIERPQGLVKTREVPVIVSVPLDEELEAEDVEAVPRELSDSEVTASVRSSIESSLTFELLRQQSIAVDDDDGKS